MRPPETVDVPVHERPRVVLFRPNPIESDSRAKKFSMTLDRLGYEVFALSAEEVGGPTAPRAIAGVQVVPVPLSRTSRERHVHKVAARRQRRLHLIDWTSRDEFITQVQEIRRSVRAARRTAYKALYDPLPEGGSLVPRHVRVGYWLGVEAVSRARLASRRTRWRAQWAADVAHRLAWRRWDAWRLNSTLLATTRGMMPELEDYSSSFAGVLDDLAPDIIHAHHPAVLGIAVRAARRRRAQGAECRVVYDAREDFTGLPEQEQGHRRRHGVLVREEARYIRQVDAVVTVSEPIVETLQRRYHLQDRPTLVLNVPVDDERIRPENVSGPTVRQAAGLAAEVPLLVYSGAVSRARGLDVVVAALPLMPGVHLAVVAVPFPHPHQGDLVEQAQGLGVQDRLHFCPPVDQDHLLHYLSGADIGVMPLRTGSANIEQALPNKLFENLHAGLTMVTSDAKLMAQFVRANGLGEVHRDGDPADLAAAVLRALKLREGRDEASWEALRRRYSWQGQESIIRDLYAALAPAPAPEGIGVEPFGSLKVHPVVALAQPVGAATGRAQPGPGPAAAHLERRS